LLYFFIRLSPFVSNVVNKKQRAFFKPTFSSHYGLKSLLSLTHETRHVEMARFIGTQGDIGGVRHRLNYTMKSLNIQYAGFH
jgi:hypothetical protein